MKRRALNLLNRLLEGSNLQVYTLTAERAEDHGYRGDLSCHLLPKSSPRFAACFPHVNGRRAESCWVHKQH